MYHSYISNFRKFIFLNLLIVALIGLIIDYLFLNHIILKTKSLPAYKYYRMLNENNENEIPIFGSSRAGGSYVPSLISQDVFNYGMDGSNFCSILFLLDKELDKDKESDVIINFDLDGLFFSKEPPFKVIPIYKEAKYIIDAENIFYNVPFVRFFGSYLYYIRFYLRTHLLFTQLYDGGGLFKIQKKSKIKFQQEIELRKQTYRNFENNQDVIKKLFDMISKTDRKIWFIIAPYHASFLDNLSDNSKKETKRFMHEIKKFGNVEFLDYRTLFSESEDYFFDTTHITYEGAKAFSKIIKNRLKEN